MSNATLAAREALWTSHTTPAPPQSFDAAVSELLDADTSGAPLAATQEAALSFLAHRLTPVAPEGLGARESLAEATRRALVFLPRLDVPRKKAFLSHVLFNVADDTDLALLAPALLRGFPAERVERALLQHAASRNPLHVNNALCLPYYLYGKRSDYDLSDLGRQELQRVAKSWLNDAEANLIVRATAERFVLPGPRRVVHEESAAVLQLGTVPTCDYLRDGYWQNGADGKKQLQSDLAGRHANHWGQYWLTSRVPSDAADALVTLLRDMAQSAPEGTVEVEPYSDEERHLLLRSLLDCCDDAPALESFVTGSLDYVRDGKDLLGLWQHAEAALERMFVLQSIAAVPLDDAAEAEVLPDELG